MEKPHWCPSERHKRPEINENIRNSLLLFKQLLSSCELVYIHVNFLPNTFTVQTANKHRKSPSLHKRKLCHGCYVGVT